MEKGAVGALYMAKGQVQQMQERVTAAGEELAQLGEGAPEGLRGVLGAMKGAGTGSLKERAQKFEAAKGQAKSYAAKIAGSKDAGKQIEALRATGGAMAEHIADLAEIERLDVSKIAGKSGKDVEAMLNKRGLMDEVRTGMAGLPPEEQAKLKAIMESKEITEDQAEYLKKTLKAVEEKVGLGTSRTAEKDTMTRLSNSLTSFAGASEKFVIAVSAAVPALGTLTEKELTDQTKKISQTGATSGG